MSPSPPAPPLFEHRLGRLKALLLAHMIREEAAWAARTDAKGPAPRPVPPAAAAPPAPRRFRKRYALAAALVLALVAYDVAARPWMATWGATPAEIAHAMPGDALVRAPQLEATRAITIQARPEAIYPWLVQLGTGRAGWYSYDWLDNGGHPSATAILPAFQGLRVGDAIPVSPDGSFGFPVAAMEPGRSLTLGGTQGPAFAGVWTLALEPIDGRSTRLVTRLRAEAPGLLGGLGLLVLEPANFIMERKMLLNLKARAEGMVAPARPSAPPDRHEHRPRG